MANWVGSVDKYVVKGKYEFKFITKDLLGKYPVDGVVNYETFNSGVKHVSKMVLKMPAQKMKIDATNQGYSQRMN